MQSGPPQRPWSRLTIRGVNRDTDLTGLLQAWSRGDARRSSSWRRWCTASCGRWRGGMLARERWRTAGSRPSLCTSRICGCSTGARPLAEPGTFLLDDGAMMRRVLVDAARARRAAKRGLGVAPVLARRVESPRLSPGRRDCDRRGARGAGGAGRRGRARWSSCGFSVDSPSRRPPRRSACRRGR